MNDYSVLIIDDDIWMQRILSKTLGSYGFKTSFLASNGYDGISIAVDSIPTLIILDILMPELSGHQTLKILKHIRTTKNIPVIMVSALSDVENLGLAVKSGTAGFISKPFTRSTVFEKLVDVFGQEKLELISKGIPMDPDELYVSDSNIRADFPVPPMPIPDTNLQIIPSSDEDTESKPKASVQSDVILKHYQDDEKKSIESIKKLLLKNKK